MDEYILWQLLAGSSSSVCIRGRGDKTVSFLVGKPLYGSLDSFS